MKLKRLKELTILYIEDELDVMEEITEILDIKVKKLCLMKQTFSKKLLMFFSF